jgi:hypothetical protein
MSFAPAHILPTTPAVRCTPGRCDICNGQYLTITYQVNSLNGLQMGPLPHRRTCWPAFFPNHPGINVQTHSLEAGSKFFVVNPGRKEGIYTSAYVLLPLSHFGTDRRTIGFCSATMRIQSEGVRNSRHEATQMFADARALWALTCLCWHGHECHCERLQRQDACGVHWVVKGIDQICGSRSVRK